MRFWYSVAATVSLAPLLAGCAHGPSLRSAAGQDVARRADNALVVMLNTRGLSGPVTAADRAIRVTGTTGHEQQGASIDALVVEDSSQGQKVVLRISSWFSSAGFSSGSKATSCFRYSFHTDGSWSRPARVHCPDVAAVTLSPSPAPLPLPPEASQRLQSLLQHLPPQTSAPDALTRVRRAFPQEMVEAEMSADALGVSVAAPDRTCLLGQRRTSGQLTVWIEPAVLAQPGELGCHAWAAARGEGRQPPH
jgi:hypothetical protein